MEGDGPFYQQPRIEIRPRPKHRFDGRIYAVASSDDSVVSAAKLDARMVMFADRPWPMRLPAIQKHRELVREYHGTEAAARLLADFCVCGTNLDEAEEEARQYMGKFVESNFYHYELLGEHFSTVKGYDAYAQKTAIARKVGMEGAVAGFMEAAVWGTPDRILRKFEERRSVLGDFELNVAFRFGGTPYDLAERGLSSSPRRSCRCSRAGSRPRRPRRSGQGCRIGRGPWRRAGEGGEGHYDDAGLLRRLLDPDAWRARRTGPAST